MNFSLSRSKHREADDVPHSARHQTNYPKLIRRQRPQDITAEYIGRQTSLILSHYYKLYSNIWDQLFW
jgi:hypothetical protein